MTRKRKIFHVDSEVRAKKEEAVENSLLFSPVLLEGQAKRMPPSRATVPSVCWRVLVYTACPSAVTLRCAGLQREETGQKEVTLVSHLGPSESPA